MDIESSGNDVEKVSREIRTRTFFMNTSIKIKNFELIIRGKKSKSINMTKVKTPI